MRSRRQKLLSRVNWYFQSSLKHITELITGTKSYNRGGRYRQVSLYNTDQTKHKTTCSYFMEYTVHAQSLPEVTYWLITAFRHQGPIYVTLSINGSEFSSDNVATSGGLQVIEGWLMNASSEFWNGSLQACRQKWIRICKKPLFEPMMNLLIDTQMYWQGRKRSYKVQNQMFTCVCSMPGMATCP